MPADDRPSTHITQALTGWVLLPETHEERDERESAENHVRAAAAGYLSLRSAEEEPARIARYEEKWDRCRFVLDNLASMGSEERQRTIREYSAIPPPPRRAEVECALSERERQTVVHRRLRNLTPLLRPGGTDRPHAVLIGGQQGAGKTTLQRLVHRALGRQGTACYDGDDNAEVHPRFVDVMREYGLDGHDVASRSLPADLHERCLDELRTGEARYDVVASHPLQREEWAKAWVDGFATHGYRVSVVYIAVSDSDSLLGIVDRYHKSVHQRGYGRWVDPDTHDESYAGVPEVAHWLEAEAHVDSLYVVDRGGYVLHQNHRGLDRTMAGSARAREVIERERDRSPTPEEQEFFDRRYNALLQRDTDPS